MSVDLDKPLQTRDGKTVRIYERNAGGDYPIHGAIFDAPQNAWKVSSWRSRGTRFSDGISGVDLVNVPVKHTREFWMLHYMDPKQEPIAWLTDPRNSAFDRSRLLAISKHVLEITEGEGL